MKKTGLLTFVLLVAVLAISPAMARKAVMAQETGDCPMQETGQVSINFNTNHSDITQVKTKLDSIVAETEALAEEAGITKIVLQSTNYNVYNNSGSGSCGEGANANFTASGSASYNVTPANKAADLMIALTKKGYNASFSVNSYRQCQ